MRTILLLDDDAFIPLLESTAAHHDRAVVVVRDEITAERVCSATNLEVVTETKAGGPQLTCLDIKEGDSIILFCSTPESAKRCLRDAAPIPACIPRIVISRKNPDYGADADGGVSHCICLDDLITDQVRLAYRKHENAKKVNALKQISSRVDNVLILLQNDPDPDAIAGGLALRVLMGRNKQTAPLGTFGAVTRSENISMIKLLDIPVATVTETMLSQYSAVAMVDVAPPYFADRGVSADIVIDHHPSQAEFDAAYVDIRPSYGATSTILAEYLIHEGIRITQRLATALIYGIKTDTMFLERGISQADIKAFTHLYPLANINMLRRIENPSLEFDEVHCFVKSLKTVRIFDSMLFAYAGNVARDDILPRLADFCLQIGGADWAVVTGICDRNIVCCVRNVGYVKHAGELVQRVFGDMGTAGGHRAMAKAVVPVRKFKKCAGVSRVGEIPERIAELFLQAAE